MKLAALILAGGRSQRMGRDKALLEISGVPLLRRTWEVARSLTPEVKIVTPRRDRYQPYLPIDAQWIEESPPPEPSSPAGPLAAFAQALTQVEADWVLLLACDLPNLHPDPVNQWCQSLSQLPTAAIAYVPKTAQGWEPLCGWYRSPCLTSLQAYLATGQRSFQAWLDQSEVVPILNVPVDLLANCNTPADWQRWQPAPPSPPRRG